MEKIAPAEDELTSTHRRSSSQKGVEQDIERSLTLDAGLGLAPLHALGLSYCSAEEKGASPGGWSHDMESLLQDDINFDDVGFHVVLCI